MRKIIFIYFFFVLFFFCKISFIFSEETITQPQYVIGKPYKIGKIWYYPRENYLYKETGIATVYSQIFDSIYTKNREKYYRDKVSAAHKTLPLPSIVRITNLQNGISINVRINDRGPKDNLRIVKLSRKAAEILEIIDYGLVEIRILSILSKQEYKRIRKDKTDISNENLEKIDDLKKPFVESENLIEGKKVVNNKEKNKSKKLLSLPNINKKDKLNFKRNTIPPVYLKIQIATFNNFPDASNFKNKFKKIYDKIVISLNIIDNHKFYNVRTVPLKNIQEAEQILSIIQKKGYKNAKTIIERKK